MGTELTTTLNRIRAHGPCEEGWATLLTGLGKTKADDEPLSYARIVEINGLDDALWCCRAEPRYDREWRLYAVWCARQVQHLMTDPRSIAALDVAERHANDEATDAELAAAREASRAAAREAAWASSRAEARESSREAVGPPLPWEAAWASTRPEAGEAAWAAAREAAWAEAGAAFLRVVKGGNYGN